VEKRVNEVKELDENEERRGGSDNFPSELSPQEQIEFVLNRALAAQTDGKGENVRQAINFIETAIIRAVKELRNKNLDEVSDEDGGIEGGFESDGSILGDFLFAVKIASYNQIIKGEEGGTTVAKAIEDLMGIIKTKVDTTLALLKEDKDEKEQEQNQQKPDAQIKPLSSHSKSFLIFIDHFLITALVAAVSSFGDDIELKDFQETQMLISTSNSYHDNYLKNEGQIDREDQVVRLTRLIEGVEFFIAKIQKTELQENLNFKLLLGMYRKISEALEGVDNMSLEEVNQMMGKLKNMDRMGVEIGGRHRSLSPGEEKFEYRELPPRISEPDTSFIISTKNLLLRLDRSYLMNLLNVMGQLGSDEELRYFKETEKLATVGNRWKKIYEFRQKQKEEDRENQASQVGAEQKDGEQEMQKMPLITSLTELIALQEANAIQAEQEVEDAHMITNLVEMAESYIMRVKGTELDDNSNFKLLVEAHKSMSDAIKELPEFIVAQEESGKLIEWIIKEELKMKKMKGAVQDPSSSPEKPNGGKIESKQEREQG
jgi:hypothetical protein